MESLKNFYTKYKKIIKAILITMIVVLTTYVIVKEVRGIDKRQLAVMAKDMSGLTKFKFIGLGLFCFSFAAIYDFILAAYYKMKMPKLEVFRIGWISQSFNNFIGFGGVAGLTIREFLYDKFDVDRKVVNRIIFIVLFSDIIGLFSLALPASIGLVQIKQYKLIPIMILMFIAVLIFIMSDKLPKNKFTKDEESVFSRAQRKLRVYLTLQSTFEWLLAALFFAFTIQFYQPEISLMESCIVYVIATIIGIASMIPGGLGSFEAASALLFKTMGYDEPNIIFSLLVCRICYTIIPWIVGLFFLITAPKGEEGKESLQKANIIASILATCVLITGIIIIISVAMPSIFIKFRVMGRLFPHYMIVLNKRFTLVIGILLVVLSSGIKNLVKVAHHLSVILLSSATVLYLIKGRNHLEATICLLIAVFLVMNARYFQGSTSKIDGRQLLKNIMTVIGIFAIYILIFNITHKVDFINGIEKYSLNYIRNNTFNVIFPPMIAIIVLFIIAGISREHITFKLNTEEGKEKFDEFYKKYSYTQYTHLFYMDDKNYFLNKAETVMFLYRPYKDKILVLGDPAGEKEDFEDAIDELIVWATENKMKVAFYQILGNNLEEYIDEGFKFLKIGEDATVNVQDFNLEGKRNKILRKTMNSMEPKGLKFKLVDTPLSDEFVSSLKEVSDEWLNGRGEMQYSLGAFKEDYIKKAPVFVIENEEGIVQGFANMLPIKGSDMLSIDLMRHRLENTEGIMDMLFISILQWAKENDYKYFDLGIAPLSNVGNKLYSGSKEKLVNLAYQYGNKIYGFKGLRKYKSKFNPEWNSVYIAYKDDLNLPEILLALVNVVYGNTEEVNIEYFNEIRAKSIE